jgi:hypothetical protein
MQEAEVDSGWILVFVLMAHGTERLGNVPLVSEIFVLSHISLSLFAGHVVPDSGILSGVIY